MRTPTQAERARLVNDFKTFAELRKQRLTKEIDALKALKEICRIFDKKFINKRFTEAIHNETGFCARFEPYQFELSDYNRYEEDYRALICLYYAEWNGAKWNWKTGDRMQADEAAKMIDIYISVTQKELDETPTLNDFEIYLDKYLKLCNMIDNMHNENSPTLTVWTANHAKRYMPYIGYVIK